VLQSFSKVPKNSTKRAELSELPFSLSGMITNMVFEVAQQNSRERFLISHPNICGVVFFKSILPKLSLDNARSEPIHPLVLNDFKKSIFLQIENKNVERNYQIRISSSFLSLSPIPLNNGSSPRLKLVVVVVWGLTRLLFVSDC